MAVDPIVDFYSGGVDHRGRTRDEILAWDDDRLESVHDYIQWMFPTAAPSAVNPFAPLVTTATVAAFENQRSLRDRLGESLDRMLRFYGLRRGNIEHVTRIMTDGARFPARAAWWLQPHNHNHLRLTRIMQSLQALGLEREAGALQQCLLGLVDSIEHPGAITATTRAFWSNALSRGPGSIRDSGSGIRDLSEDE